jgi:hypothetical protein
VKATGRKVAVVIVRRPVAVEATGLLGVAVATGLGRDLVGGIGAGEGGRPWAAVEP